MTQNTLKITFREREKHREAAEERLRRAEDGERSAATQQDARYILNFEEFDDIARLMRTPNLTLIETIVSQQPESIRETADAVDRDYREVHRNLQELEGLGVIEFASDGQRKQPTLRHGADTIDFSIRFPQTVEHGDTPGASA